MPPDLQIRLTRYEIALKQLEEFDCILAIGIEKEHFSSDHFVDCELAADQFVYISYFPIGGEH